MDFTSFNLGDTLSIASMIFFAGVAWKKFKDIPVLFDKFKVESDLHLEHELAEIKESFNKELSAINQKLAEQEAILKITREDSKDKK